MTERARKAVPQTAEDTIKLLEASLVLVRLAAYKTCSCGRVFATRADFERLPLCGSGYQPEFNEQGDQRTDVRLCLRNCSCGSTLSVEVPCPAPDVDDDEPCDVCSIVGGHDEDIHAEHDEERRADREYDAFDGARFDGGGE
jgi:hypothetical protein